MKTATLANPIYSYKDENGNTVKVNLYEKDKIPKNVDRKVTKLNICDNRIKSLLPKEDLSDETIDRINKIWEERYNVTRSWSPPLTTIDKIIKWKEFRYDKKRNPNRKWHQGLSYMGDLYTWVYNLKKDENKINSIIGVFNEKEKRELISEGFPVK